MKSVMFNFALLEILCVSLVLAVSEQIDFKDVVFVILSQNNSYHTDKAIRLKNEINAQTNNNSPVYLTHEDIKHLGDWTVLPLLPIIWERHKNDCLWLFLCTCDTKIRVPKLLEVLQKFDEGKLFIGRALKDSEPTIIHHFSSLKKLTYPLFAVGFGISNALLKRLAEKITNEDDISRGVDFSIDASYELSSYIWEGGNGPLLTNVPQFCTRDSEDCATYTSYSHQCRAPVELEKIVFAVKTCKKFHKERVPVIQRTWGNRAGNLIFYSDEFDETIPTVKLNVTNTDYGHCAKTRAIIDDVYIRMKLNKDLKWAVITDDDTILSVARTQDLLSCFNHSERYAIGERYGYNIYYGSGYNYITGGGGFVLSKPAIVRFIKYRQKCECPSSHTPDDMFLLGVCLKRLNITLVHISEFHQARPNDYNHDYLSIADPISFHKHWMVNPVQIYEDWFQSADLLHKKDIHVEL